MSSSRKSAVITEQHDVLGGKAVVLRVPVSGDVYQFRMWVAEDRKYVRKSLNTRDLNTALSRAETLYLQLYSDLASGKKLFGITLSELVEDYLTWRKEDVRAGTITAGRLVTLSSHLKHLLSQKGADTKVSELNRTSLFDYAQHRRTADGAALVTVRNEQTTLNHMMKYAYRKGYAHFEAFEFAPLQIKEASRRDTFTLEEYDDLVRYLRSYVSKTLCRDDEKRKQRLLIRDLVLIASNTMLRIGELRQLKWGDVVSISEHKDEQGRQVHLVTLRIRGETAKTRKSRLITTRGGRYFMRLRERTQFKHKTDYVFAVSSGQKMLSKRLLYSSWDELMQGINIDYKSRNVTWYSLRHFGITCRLRAGASVFDLSRIAGNSVAEIERHYGHFDQSMSMKVALKSFVYSKDGIDVLVD